MHIRIRKEEEVSAILNDLDNLRERDQNVDQDDLESTEEKDSDDLKAELRIDCEQDANVKAPLPEEPESPEPQDKADEAATPAVVEKDDLESTEEKEKNVEELDAYILGELNSLRDTIRIIDQEGLGSTKEINVDELGNEVAVVLEYMDNLREIIQDFDEQVMESTEDMDIEDLKAELGIDFEKDANINVPLPEVPKCFKPQGKAYAPVHNPKDDDLNAMLAELGI